MTGESRRPVDHRARLVARTSYSSIIDAWFSAGQEDLARECADLAVRQGVWSHPLQRDRDHVDGLTATPFHDPDTFWFVGHLERRFAEIRGEVEAMLRGAAEAVRATVEDDWLLRSGTWDQAYLFREGEWQDDVCSHMPVTRSVLAEIPEMTTLSPGVILLSRLSPGTHIMPHCGSTNAVLRVHLPIIASSGATIRVGDRTVEWETGRCLVFDDSFEHEVWHRGQADRLVLIMDILHPEVDAARRAALIAHRPTVEQRVGAFMRERGLTSVSLESGRVGCTPDTPTSRQVTAYLDELQVNGIVLRGDGSGRYEPRVVGTD